MMLLDNLKLYGWNYVAIGPLCSRGQERYIIDDQRHVITVVIMEGEGELGVVCKSPNLTLGAKERLWEDVVSESRHEVQSGR